MTFNWSDKNIATLRHAWVVEGKTGTEIGNILGVTRSAVLSKVRGLAITRCGNPVPPRVRDRSQENRRFRDRSKETPCSTHMPDPAIKKFQNATLGRLGLILGFIPVTTWKAPPPAPMPAPEKAAEAPPPLPARIRAPLVASACQWPHGEPRTAGFHFCGAPAEMLGKPYCAAHNAVAYVRHVKA